MKWLALCLIGTPVLADCPPNPDIADAEAQLLSRLLDVRSELAARAVNNDLWRLWVQAPDDQSQALLDKGMAQREAFDLLGAAVTLDRLIDYCPEYSEGLNQRAFVAFLQNDMATSLDLLDRTLDIRPVHLGALTGKALTLMQLGREEEAQVVLRQALRLNPFLAERRFLTEPPGEPL
mgnify:CR=1 FL=1